MGYQLSGRWIVDDRDASQFEIKPATYSTLLGPRRLDRRDEPCVTIDCQGIAEWAVRGPSQRMVTTARIGDPARRTLKSQYDEKVSVVLATFDGVLGRSTTTGDATKPRNG